VESIDLHGETADHGVLMTIRCGRGTYIRSICNDLGEMLDCPAHMRFLLRSQSGVFRLDTAMTLEEAAELKEQGRLAENLLALDMPLRHLPRVNARPALRKQVENGVKLPLRRLDGDALEEGQVTRVYLNDEFWGMAAREGDMLVWRALIAPEG